MVPENLYTYVLDFRYQNKRDSPSLKVEVDAILDLVRPGTTCVHDMYSIINLPPFPKVGGG